MSTLRRETLSCANPRRALFGLVLTLVGASCSKAATYTYVDVHVSIDQQTVSANQLYLVTSCEFQVLGAEVSDAVNLRCPENHVQYDVGTFQWTSGASSGALQFRVRIFDANLVILGEATSDAIPVSPGKHLETSVLVLGVEPTTGPDAGDDASFPTDGGVDQSAVTDVASDASDGPASDGSPDNANDSATDA